MNAVSDVVIVDTSVLLNLLDVPQHNGQRDLVVQQFKQFVQGGASLLLPIAVVFETGNHIADLADGGNRRRYATVLCEEVDKALRNKAPWVLVPPPDDSQLAKWLDRFPDCAMREINLKHLSLMELWESQCKKLFGTRVLIWSRDNKLKACDRQG